MRVLSRPRTSPFWLAAGAGFTGATTYVLLVVTARAVGPDAYSRFSVFWAAIVITSFGLFLPVEQVLARRAARSDGSRSDVERLLSMGVRRGWALAGVAVLVSATIWVVRWGPETEVIVVIAAFGLATGGFVTQFAARGMLSGRIALRDYALVIATDSGLRAVVVLALWLTGVTSVGAYALTVGASSLACGLLGLALALRASTPFPAPVSPPTAPAAAPATPIGRRELAATVTAALSMQLLLNSAIVIAGLVASERDAVLAGRLLAVIVIARLPVFVVQSGQAAYVGRIAHRAHTGDTAGMRRLLVRLAGLVAAAASGTVLVAAAAGPPVIRLLFGHEYAISRSVATMVALGVAAYLVASVTNDVAVALGEHRRLWPAWMIGSVAAALVAVTLTDLVLRSTVPLLVGSVVAAALLLPVVRRRVGIPA